VPDIHIRPGCPAASPLANTAGTEWRRQSLVPCEPIAVCRRPQPECHSIRADFQAITASKSPMSRFTMARL
jgi:hypothetical protein